MGQQCGSVVQPPPDDLITSHAAQDRLFELAPPIGTAALLGDNLVPVSVGDKSDRNISPSPPAVTAAPAGAAEEQKELVAASGSYAPPATVEQLVGDGICAICLDQLRNQAQTIALCGHIFHRACINSYNSNLCPQCRHPIDNEGENAIADSVRFQVGSLVVFAGLRTHVSLNGLRGRITSPLSDSRFEVRTLDSGHLFRVREENLLAVSERGSRSERGAVGSREAPASASSTASSGGPNADGAVPSNVGEYPPPGTIVQLVGLRAAHEYNGQMAEVMFNDVARGRYEVRMQDGTMKVVRYHNTRVCDSAAGAEPAVPDPDLQRWSRPGECTLGEPISVNGFVAQVQRHALDRAKPEFIAYARYLGIDPVANQDLLWIAEESLDAPLPMEWTKHHDSADRVFYYYRPDRVSSWTHPLEQLYRDAYTYIAECRSSFLTEEEQTVKFEQLKLKVETTERDAQQESRSWTEHMSEQGHTFYYCNDQRLSTWTDPRPALRHEAQVWAKVLRVLSKKCAL